MDSSTGIEFGPVEDLFIRQEGRKFESITTDTVEHRESGIKFGPIENTDIGYNTNKGKVTYGDLYVSYDTSTNHFDFEPQNSGEKRIVVNSAFEYTN